MSRECGQPHDTSRRAERDTEAKTPGHRPQPDTTPASWAHREHRRKPGKRLDSVPPEVALRQTSSRAERGFGRCRSGPQETERRGEGTRRIRRVPVETTLEFSDSIADQGRATVRRSPDFSRITTRCESN